MRALVVGATGQVGSYLTEQLAAEGYEVFGTSRNPTVTGTLLPADLLDQGSLELALRHSKPDEVYNLAAIKSPGGGWGTPQPPLLAEVTGVGVVHLLDAMVKLSPDAKLVHASSSAIYDPHRYGLYGISKKFAHDAVVGYRGQLHCSNAVLFSPTSPRQSSNFLARRICSTITRIAGGSEERLVLGDVDSRRDWVYAPDCARAMKLIARQDRPGDWVIATGRTRSVRELTETALRIVGLDWDDVVTIDMTLPRVPHEVFPAAAEARLAAARGLGWKPETSFAEMVEAML